MGCRIITAGGISIIACGRGSTARSCRYCSRPSSKLCDFVVQRTMLMTHPPQVGEVTTCDEPLCGQCAVSVGPDKDHCRVHKARGDQEAPLK